MSDVTLKGYKVTELEFRNKVDGGIRINLEHKYSYNVGYSQNNCKCDFTVEIIGNGDPDKFYIKMIFSGIFEYKPDIKKEALHVATFKEIFPYVRAAVSTITANSGIAAIMIPPVDIEGESIYRISINGQPEE